MPTRSFARLAAAGTIALAVTCTAQSAVGQTRPTTTLPTIRVTPTTVLAVIIPKSTTTTPPAPAAGGTIPPIVISTPTITVAPLTPQSAPAPTLPPAATTTPPTITPAAIGFGAKFETTGCKVSKLLALPLKSAKETVGKPAVMVTFETSGASTGLTRLFTESGKEIKASAQIEFSTKAHTWFFAYSPIPGEQLTVVTNQKTAGGETCSSSIAKRLPGCQFTNVSATIAQDRKSLTLHTSTNAPSFQTVKGFSIPGGKKLPFTAGFPQSEMAQDRDADYTVDLTGVSIINVDLNAKAASNGCNGMYKLKTDKTPRVRLHLTTMNVIDGGDSVGSGELLIHGRSADLEPKPPVSATVKGWAASIDVPDTQDGGTADIGYSVTLTLSGPNPRFRFKVTDSDCTFGSCTIFGDSDSGDNGDYAWETVYLDVTATAPGRKNFSLTAQNNLAFTLNGFYDVLLPDAVGTKIV